MAALTIIYRRHATDQMEARDIAPREVRHVLETGETIEWRDTAEPFPRRLVLGYTVNGPLHVVAEDDGVAGVIYVRTAYRPSLMKWRDDWRTRRES